jgi:O-antigen chain-terminating methyltransferase
VRRLEVLVSDVLRRSEATDARLATELQRAQDKLERQARDVAALMRIVGGPVPGQGDLAAEQGPAVPLPVSPYTLFEEVERGSRDEVMRTLRGYLTYFKDAEPVVDLGCGRGEFLELAQLYGVPAYGVDTDAAAVEHCLSLGLKARTADVIEHLSGLPEASVGGVFSAQVVEHLPPELLWPLLEEVARVLRPGGHVVVETPNPATFATHVHSFWRDPTHLRPVPAPALWFAGNRVGLVVVETLYSSPVPDPERLKPVRVEGSADPELAESYNRSVTMLNELLYGPQNVAVVMRKPEPAEG